MPTAPRLKTVTASTAAGYPMSRSAQSAYLSFTLHAHLPYVINYGTWPHGLEWLFEAAAETYLPLIRVLGNLERDGVRLHCNLVLSPILLEQLAHPVFTAEFPGYLSRKVVAAREDEAYFLQAGDHPLVETARFWQGFYTQALDDFKALGGDLIQSFRRFNESGQISVITGAATHGFLPLLGTDESVHAQIHLAAQTHKRHMGVAPKGVWLPECGYRPAGYWEFPAIGFPAVDEPGLHRAGIDQVVGRAGLEYFFVDSQLVQHPEMVFTQSGKRRAGATREPSLYAPHLVASTTMASKISASNAVVSNGDADQRTATSVFARDPRTAVQVWSGDAGYPGDFDYLDFHKKRFPGGHRYWRVTGANLDIAHKQPYSPQAAAERVKMHASHFVSLVRETLQSAAPGDVPPILCALYDAELFGHWWFEGASWLEAVARTLQEQKHQADASELNPARPPIESGAVSIELIDCETYLERYPPAEAIAMREGSWGAGGSSQVWLNHETSWTYSRIYAAEIDTRTIATSGTWRDCELGTRIAKQLCRELLLLESSDWQFLISTGGARAYAESRFVTHHDNYTEIRAMYSQWEIDGSLSEEQYGRLKAIELRDSIFTDIDPGMWAKTSERRPMNVLAGSTGVQPLADAASTAG